MATKKSVGLVLGSGAARGWSHIGLLEVLDEAGIKPDIICGTSMGALVGAAYASGRLAEIKDWAMAADWRTVASLVDVNLMEGGLVAGSRIVNWMGTLSLAANIEDTAIPFAAVATDLTTGREVWLRSGALAPALRASISLPGIFSPVLLDGQWLVDGALVNPVPVSLCRAMGADTIIAVDMNEDVLGRSLVEELPERPISTEEQTAGNMMDLLASLPRSLQRQASNFNLFKSRTPGYFDVLSNALNIMQDHITRSRLAGEPPHVLVSPRVAEIGLMDFHCAATAIAAGRQAAELALPVIEAKL
ncbi:patatin-like phospholipase RssA [Pelagibacterium lacus]|uniref:Patatin-like phospholipase RssA n=1 Tax=Pelagibacterium lacus TaxID=2282655 RepID=A0A369W7U5_9HYPH|nr:patatin-like phospholipase RssA [Pelagibacterium lacus]RDE10413.1 patatin-like phospholipase RssA [Pelagibacterium lacus]